MNLRVLVFGDIVGSGAVDALQDRLPSLSKEYTPDLIVANVENAAGGFGVTKRFFHRFQNMGIDVMTSGNHIFDRKEVFDFIDEEDELIRPINFPPHTPGRGYRILERKDQKIAVVNAMGRIFMNPLDCPFRKMKSVLKELEDQKVDIILVDFHAEATSEKLLFGLEFDGQVSAVWGTHTHVRSADASILDKGTAYITDLGMCGAKDSVLGMKIGQSYRRLVQQLPTRFSPVVDGKMILNYIVIDIDLKTKKAISIESNSIGVTLSE